MLKSKNFKLTFILFLTISILPVSCEERQISQEVLTQNHEVMDRSGLQNQSILSYFTTVTDESILIEVEDYTYERSFDPKDCLPQHFLPLLNEFIQPTQSTSTGAKPVMKIPLSNSDFMLVVVQQDDYGPIYYGMIYSSKNESITKCETLAFTWGDAGDTQTQHSILSNYQDSIVVHKFIETCHEKLVDSVDQLIPETINCIDSNAFCVLSISP